MIIACAYMASLHVVIDFSSFHLKTIQGYIYVVLIEIYLQAAIYFIAISKSGTETNKIHFFRVTAIFLVANVVFLAFKFQLITKLANASYISNIPGFLFATGDKYIVASLSDGRADAIANALYHCWGCANWSSIPLNEPFIVYIFIAISFVAGEFNQHIIWLTLEALQFFTALLLLKAVNRSYPFISYPWIISIAYILSFEIHGATLLLFKDTIFSFIAVCIFYIYVHNIREKENNLYIKSSTFIFFIMFYYLRSAALFLIYCLTILHCLLERKRWLVHVSVLLATLLSINFISSNLIGSTNTTQVIRERAIENFSTKQNSKLDTHNFTYINSIDNSVLVKLQILDINWSNFFYAPLIKGILQFILPLPEDKFISVLDSLQRIGSAINFILFPMLIVGILSLIKKQTLEGLYLLALFGLFFFFIAGAGPMIYPRYRILVMPFFLLIVVIGFYSIPIKYSFFILCISSSFLIFILLNYDYLRTLVLLSI